MDGQAITTESDLERFLPDERMEAKRLSFSLLKTITNDFSHEIGRGGFAVYKGMLDHKEVVVKHLSQNSNDDKEFNGEVQCLMKAKHKNIVRILGYCSDRQVKMVKFNGDFVMEDVCQRLLCLEYVPNGSLNEYMKDASREWGKCYEIIKGVCEGVHYLHKERIVHLDLKPANILLDNDMVPKITDFGMSRCFDESQTHCVTSKVSESLGYLAPELFFSGKITFEQDIYSLGVIITEMLTGDKGHDLNVEKGQEHWSHKLEGSKKELQLEQIRVCTEVAQSCLEFHPEKRPSAQTIINILEQNKREECCIKPGASSHNPRRPMIYQMLLEENMEAKPLPFSLLKCITNDFSHEIGSGGFAVVYKGLLDHREVAVKQLSQISIDEKEFIREVQCLMKARHKNIVRILGYCSDTQGEMIKYNGKFVMADVERKRLICIEYVPNGTLDKYIDDAPHEWEKCYKIIKGVCEGLHYLHKERIVHRDLKPANILLDNDMVPKITDFGISRCFDESQTHHFTSKLIGSFGYRAPELIHHGEITFKTDIYSLGTIITEILTSDKAIPEVEKVQEHWRHKLEGSQKELKLEQIRVCTEVAQSCLQDDPEKRPLAQTIIDILQRTEREDWCVESAATPLRYTVADRNISKQQHPRPLSKKHTQVRNPEFMARIIKMLMQAISKVYARDMAGLSFEELYRSVYNVVIGNMGEELYSSAETTIASEVQSLCRPLDDAAPTDSTLFLQELLTKWDRHISALRVIRDAFEYMERNFVPVKGKTPIYELGLRLWRDEMVRSDKILTRLIEAVKQQKGGEDDELVAGVNKMLNELRANLKDDN